MNCKHFKYRYLIVSSPDQIYTLYSASYTNSRCRISLYQLPLDVRYSIQHNNHVISPTHNQNFTVPLIFIFHNSHWWKPLPQHTCNAMLLCCVFCYIDLKQLISGSFATDHFTQAQGQLCKSCQYLYFLPILYNIRTLQTLNHFICNFNQLDTVAINQLVNNKYMSLQMKCS